MTIQQCNGSKYELLFMYIYVTIRKFFGVKWLRLCRWIGNFTFRSFFSGQLFLNVTNIVQPVEKTKEIKKSSVSSYHHSVLMLGDGFAEGFGDGSIIFGHRGGLAHYMPKLIGKSDIIRHQWTISNAGITDSRAKDWSPLNLTKKGEKNYFHSLCSTLEFAQAEIVVILVGSMDAAAVSISDSSSSRTNSSTGNGKSDDKDDKTAEETLKHLKDLCDAIRKKNKRVCLGTVSDLPSNESHMESQRKVNRLIQEYCSSTKYDDIPVVCGPQVNSPLFRKSETRAFDGMHLNGQSYKVLTKNAFEMLEPMMVKVEWGTWKEKLSKVEYDPQLYD